MTAFKYGKLDPHSEETHPRVKLRNHLAVPPAVPAVVDWASKVISWPMYDNDRLGDCTCAALGHAVEAWTTYSEGNTLTLPVSAVLSLYEAMGYNPNAPLVNGVNPTDAGAVEQNVLKYVEQNGLGGHKIRAFAQVDHTDLVEMKQALDLFGTVYVGFQVPQSAETQFGQGQPWTVVPGSPSVGGHAIDIQKWDADYIYAVTWGKLQPMTPEFWLTYGDEAWVILTDDWINANGESPTGLDLTALLAEFDALYVDPAPEPAPVTKKHKFNFWAWLKNLF